MLCFAFSSGEVMNEAGPVGDVAETPGEEGNGAGGGIGIAMVVVDEPVCRCRRVVTHFLGLIVVVMMMNP